MSCEKKTENFREHDVNKCLGTFELKCEKTCIVCTSDFSHSEIHKNLVGRVPCHASDMKLAGMIEEWYIVLFINPASFKSILFYSYHPHESSKLKIGFVNYARFCKSL